MTLSPQLASPELAGPVAPADLADGAVELVRRWLVASREVPVDAAAQRLAGVLSDPNGLDFAVGFVDGVVRPEDLRIAARTLRGLVPLTPRFLPAPLRGLIALGGWAAPIAPGIVVPIARRALRHMVRHLVVDAGERSLGRSIRSLRAREGVRLNVNLLGEAILGEAEAARRLAGTRALLERPDISTVSIKVSSTVAPHSAWSFDDAVAHAVDSLLPLFRIARDASPRKFINLDMEEYKDLDLTIAVFTALLEREELRDLEAGIVLQAYLPDALGAMQCLQAWAAERVAGGGAPIKVRVVKGANLPMEQVDAETHGWPLATWGSKLESDASYKAVLDYALTAERTANVRIGVAGHNLFDIALAHLLAERRGVAGGMEVEMLLGMATAQAEVVRRDVGALLLYTPVVHAREFDVAIAYLVRRLEEGASQDNFMSAVFQLDDEPELFARERDRFLASVAAMPASTPAPHRVQDRTVPVAPWTGGFASTPDTDAAIAANRAWAASIRARVPGSTIGRDLVEAHWIDDVEQADALIAAALDAGAAWRGLGAAERAAILHRAGDELEARRAELLEVMASECGKVLDQGDPEVSEAVDFAHYYAERGLELEALEGARFTPARLTVVTPPWNFPVAIPAGSTLAALAAGSPVVIKPAPQARRSGAVMVEALWAAGVPREVLRLAQAEDGPVAERIVAHPAVERVILTGAYETAELFRGFRQDLPVLAETSGKNAIIVTPSADLDLAAKDVAASAFGHAGQKCSAASLVVLVGSAARSRRFRAQLVDAVRSLRVGPPSDEASQVGPVIEPAASKLLRGLTELADGETWLVRPTRLDDAGALWTPGVRDGVRPGSEFHRTEYFGPVLGIMTAATLEEAIGIVNAVDYGLTSGLHSLDDAEVQHWLSAIEAGNAYVNRGITGAIVQRQPFGGWKRSAVGAGAKAGGPNYLFGLGSFEDAAPRASGALDELARTALAAAADSDRPWLEAALADDLVAVAEEFGVARDVTGLAVEQNVFRYAPVPVVVRASTAAPAALLRTVAAGSRVGSAITVSTTEALPGTIAAGLRALGAEVLVEGTGSWAARVRELATTGGRVRLLGGDTAEIAAVTGGAPNIAVWGGEVVSAGRIEALPYLREQAVSITAHRFGTPRRCTVPALVRS